MRRFSRWMPPSSSPRTSPLVWVLLAAIGAAAVAALVAWPGARFIAAGLGGLGVLGHRLHTRRLRRLAAERPDESICTFARAFSRQEMDPWIVRATYEELAPWTIVDGRQVALRASDRFDKDLHIDSEDLEDAIKDIAWRTGRSLENPERNPFYGHLHTVGDIVRFLALQPPRKAA